MKFTYNSTIKHQCASFSYWKLSEGQEKTVNIPSLRWHLFLTHTSGLKFHAGHWSAGSLAIVSRPWAWQTCWLPMQSPIFCTGYSCMGGVSICLSGARCPPGRSVSFLSCKKEKKKSFTYHSPLRLDPIFLSRELAPPPLEGQFLTVHVLPSLLQKAILVLTPKLASDSGKVLLGWDWNSESWPRQSSYLRGDLNWNQTLSPR